MEAIKNKLLLLITLALFSSLMIRSQEKTSECNYFSVSPRIGYDLPTYNNETPYIDYNEGLDLDISVDLPSFSDSLKNGVAIEKEILYNDQSFIMKVN